MEPRTQRMSRSATEVPHSGELPTVAPIVPRRRPVRSLVVHVVLRPQRGRRVAQPSSAHRSATAIARDLFPTAAGSPRRCDPYAQPQNGGNVAAMSNEVRSRWPRPARGLALVVTIGSPWAHAASMFIVTSRGFVWPRTDARPRATWAHQHGRRKAGRRPQRHHRQCRHAGRALAAAVTEMPLPAGVLVRLQSGGYRFKLPTLNRKLKLGIA
jgi:hypothetical protein